MNLGVLAGRRQTFAWVGASTGSMKVLVGGGGDPGYISPGNFEKIKLLKSTFLHSDLCSA